MAYLTTHREVIEALGGATRVAARYGKGSTTVYAWLSDGAFPAKTYRTMIRRLESEGHSAAPELWNWAEEVDGADGAPREEVAA